MQYQGDDNDDEEVDSEDSNAEDYVYNSYPEDPSSSDDDWDDEPPYDRRDVHLGMEMGMGMGMGMAEYDEDRPEVVRDTTYRFAHLF